MDVPVRFNIFTIKEWRAFYVGSLREFDYLSRQLVRAVSEIRGERSEPRIPGERSEPIIYQDLELGRLIARPLREHPQFVAPIVIALVKHLVGAPTVIKERVGEFIEFMLCPIYVHADDVRMFVEITNPVFGRSLPVEPWLNQYDPMCPWNNSFIHNGNYRLVPQPTLYPNGFRVSNNAYYIATYEEEIDDCLYSWVGAVDDNVYVLDFVNDNGLGGLALATQNNLEAGIKAFGSLNVESPDTMVFAHGTHLVDLTDWQTDEPDVVSRGYHFVRVNPHSLRMREETGYFPRLYYPPSDE